MAKDNQDTRTLLLMGLLALWAVVFAYSVYFLFITPATDDGFSRGLSRINGFLGWQGVAGMLGFACWGIGWSFPKGSGIRRVSALPLGMALALVIVVVGMVMFGG